jgi:hypothetical protein
LLVVLQGKKFGKKFAQSAGAGLLVCWGVQQLMGGRFCRPE